MKVDRVGWRHHVGTILWFTGIAWLFDVAVLTAAFPFIDVGASTFQIAATDVVSLLVAVPLIIGGRRLRSANA